MKKLIAIGLTCCLPTGLAALDPAAEAEADLGTMSVMVVEDSSPLANDVLCTRGVADKGSECMAVHRAVLTARVKKVSALHERGRWM